MHIIVVGAGRTGRHIIELATADKNEVFVIERDKELAKAISKEFDCKVIVDDATSSDALKEAEIDDADAVIVTTNDDAVNLLVMMLAKDHGIDNLVSAVFDENHLHLFDRIGVDTIDSPFRINAQHLYFSVKNPSVKDFLDLGGGVEITEFTVKKKAQISGKNVRDLEEMDDWPENARVVVIRRESDFIIPKGNTSFKEEDSVAILSKEDVIEKINKIFEEKNGKEE